MRRTWLRRWRRTISKKDFAKLTARSRPLGITHSKREFTRLERREKRTERLGGCADGLWNGGVPRGEATSLWERSMIPGAWSGKGNNKSAVARVVGVHRNPLQGKRVDWGRDAARPRARRKPMSRA